jgi:glycosyltransferase involved in cell wall biosynthesis
VGEGQSITACVIARDEAQNLGELLPLLRWADEILVLVDDATADDSAAVAGRLADRVEVLPFRSFAAFRNAALQLASAPWVLFVDADERVPPELAEEARHAARRAEAALAVGDPAAPAGYWIPRRNIVLGRLLRGGGWAPDAQLRLLRRDRAQYDEARPVHEVAVLDGPSGHLSQPLVHFNYSSVRQFWSKQRRYTDRALGALRALGPRLRRRSLVGAPIREFWRRYVTLAGWRDGRVGLFLALALGYWAFQRTRLARRA